MITIQSNRACLNDLPVEWRPTRNISGRMEPQLIVVHETAGHLTFGNSADWLRAPENTKTSAHVTIERDGTILQLADFDRVTWHAGISSWEGRANCNGFSIGIELVGPGKLRRAGAIARPEDFKASFPIEDCKEMTSAAHGGAGWWLPFTREQIDTLRALVAALLQAYPRISDVRGHFEISPGRKVDPNPTLDLVSLRVMCAHRFVPDKVMVESAQARLLELGYNVDEIDGLVGPKTRGQIRVFQEQNGLAMNGELDNATWERLNDKNAVEMTSGSRRDTKVADVKTTETKVSEHLIKADTAYEGWQAYDSMEKAFAKASSARSMGDNASTLLNWASSPSGTRFIGMMLFLGLLYWGVRRVNWKRLQARAQGIPGRAIDQLAAYRRRLRSARA